jgi:DNA-binding NtrC family response regulator
MIDKKILVVDDEILLCWSLRKKLENLGFEVSTVTDGEKAVEILKQNKFDAVVTDLRLPGVDGFYVGNTAKNIVPDVKLFMISAFGDDEAKLKSKQNNFLEFFDKPFDLEEVSNLIASDILET